MNDVIIYNDGELERKVSIDHETFWLNRNQLSELFDRDIKTIGKHINNVFEEKKLDKLSVVAKFATTASDEKIYNMEFYDLTPQTRGGYTHPKDEQRVNAQTISESSSNVN